MGAELISIRFSGMISGPPSIGRPKPSKTRPSMSCETASSMERPKKRTLQSCRLMPEEPSNNCSKATSPLASKTRPRRVLPSPSLISANSPYLTSLTFSTSIKGPTSSRTVLYSFSIRLHLLWCLPLRYANLFQFA